MSVILRVLCIRPLAQGIIYLCEELIRQNDAFPSQFESKVASTDVIEQELLEQIKEMDRMKTSMEAISQTMPIPGMDTMANLFTVMRKKLQEKLDHLHEFNQTSSNNYSTAIQLSASIATGLAEVQSGKGFSLASGTFSTQGLNMEWTASIQAITEEKSRKADHSIKDGEMCGRLEEKSPIRKAWDDKVDDVVKMFETVKKMWNGTVIGTGKAVEDGIKSMETLSNMDIRNMDIGTFINVTYAILHLDETAKNMWHAFSSTMKRDIIDGDAESRTQWTTYGLTQIAIGLIADKGLGKASLVTKGIKGAGGASTLAKGVTLVKELKQASEILQSFKKDVSYAFSGGNILTKIPQSELNQAYYNFAKTKNATNTTGTTKPNISKKHDEIAHDSYYGRKDFRTKINNANYSPHDNKHLKARTSEEAKKFSETGKRHAQYLPSANNKVIEKEALIKGHIIDNGNNGNNNYYFIYDTGKVIDYDNGKPTSWIRAELTSGNVYHGHPIAGERLNKYLRKLD